MLILLICSCVSSEVLLEKGKYLSAIDHARRQLQKDPNNLAEFYILNQSLRLHQDKEQQKLTLRSFSTKEQEYKERLSTLYGLYSLFQEHSHYLNEESLNRFQRIKMDISDFEKSFYDYYLNVAEEHKSNYYSLKKKIYAQKSYNYYRKAKDLDFEYYFPQEDMQKMLSFAQEFIYVSIDPFEQEVSWHFQMHLSKKIGFRNFSFIKNQQTDCHVHIDCAFFNYEDHEDQSCESHEKEIEDGYTTHIDTSGKKIKTPKYRTVQATTYETTTTRRAQWNVEFHVKDISGACTKSIREHRFIREFEIETESYSGDEKALPSCYSEDIFPDELPDQDDIKTIFAQDILKYFEAHF